jgi:23S rRNA (guanosine2251-2'-O)-methyltransferase
VLTLRNPHSVLAAIEARPRDVRQVRVPGGRGGSAEAHGAWGEVVAAAERAGIAVVPPGLAPARPRGRDQRHRRRDAQPGPARTAASEAIVRERDPVALDRLFEHAEAGDLWVALDSVQDPQNVGSIARTAAFFGVRGLVVMSDRAAPLSSVVYDVASGGIEAFPHAEEPNLRRALEASKAAGVWVLGSSEHATQPVHDVPRDRPWLVVLGNEERGLRRLTLETCDEVCVIPGRGEAVTSLNVAVSAGILLAALAR